MRTCILLIVLLWPALGRAAAELAVSTNDLAGQRTTSASYTQDGSLTFIAGISTSASVTLQHGYIGQLTNSPGISPLQNGSFEFNGGHQSGLAAGWTFGGTPDGVKIASGEGASEGNYAAVFNGAVHATGGLLSQTFTTVPGTIYTVQFDFGNFGYSGDLQKLRVEVHDGNSAISGQQLINSGSGQGGAVMSNLTTIEVGDNTQSSNLNAMFNTVSFTFTSLSTSSTLAFKDVSSGDISSSDGVLDNVQVFVTGASNLPSTPLELWRSANFAGNFTNTGNAANSADPDGDGYSNLLEYAFGTDPNNPASGLGEITFDAGAITLRAQPKLTVTNTATGVNFRANFGRRKNYVAAGLTYTVQFSADMQTWQNSTATPTVLASDAEMDAVYVKYPFFLQNGRKAQFYRVEVSVP